MIQSFVWAGTEAAIQLLAPAVACALLVGATEAFLFTVPPLALTPLGRAKGYAIAYGRHAVSCGCFALLGLVAGMLAGNSRTPAITALLPALLSLIGALSAIFFAKDAENRYLVFACVLALAVCTFLGANWGAFWRIQVLHAPEAIERRGDLLARCAIEELRVKKILAAYSNEIDTTKVNLNCSSYTDTQ